MNTFVTSDHHFHHEKIINYSKRPFKSVEEMDAVMEKNWNEEVKPDDLVIHVGDFSFGTQEDIEATVAQLHGRKWLVLGNHDLYHVHRKITKDLFWFYYKIGFERVMTKHYEIVDGYRILFTHRPQMDLDLTLYDVNFHGHVHEKWFRRDRLINVGVDVNEFRPRLINELVRYAPTKGETP